MNTAIFSPSRNPYSETFIQAHKNYLIGNVKFYYGLQEFIKLENKENEFKYKLYAKQLFCKVHERLPIEDLVSKIHFEDEWIFTGLPSASMFFDNDSPIKLIGQFTNNSHSEASNCSQNQLSLSLESNLKEFVSIPLSKESENSSFSARVSLKI